MPEVVTIVRGGITVVRESSGNLTIAARGNGTAHVQKADVSDLMAALAEMLRTDPDGNASIATKEVTGRTRRLSANGNPADDDTQEKP